MKSNKSTIDSEEDTIEINTSEDYSNALLIYDKFQDRIEGLSSKELPKMRELRKKISQYEQDTFNNLTSEEE